MGKEGEAKKIELEEYNLQIAVWRHHDKLFALDNRCSHLGGPLCNGDVEDLANHIGRSKSVKLRGKAKREDGVVTCPEKCAALSFNLRTGEDIMGGPMRQQVYPVQLLVIDEDTRYIEVEVGSD